jgi:hypothetical protein
MSAVTLERSMGSDTRSKTRRPVNQAETSSAMSSLALATGTGAEALVSV